MEFIDRNLLLIIYRYEWQSKIYEVNRDYEDHIVLDIQQHPPRNQLKLKAFGNTLVMNYRDTSYLPLMMFVGNPNLPIFSLRNSPDDVVYFGPIDSPLPINYFFSSTKTLLEIKKSGINCLSIIDNR